MASWSAQAAATGAAPAGLTGQQPGGADDLAETATFDRDQLFELLEEIRGYFAELRYIDLAMQYLEGERAGPAQEYLGGVVTPGTEYVEVEFGRTFPFTKRYPVRGDWFDPAFGLFDDTRAERILDRLPGFAAAADGWAATEIDGLTERVRPFTWPRGTDYESGCIEPLHGLQTLLADRVSHDFGLLQHSLSDWKGEAADNFGSRFYFPFEHTLRSQQELLGTLLRGIASAQAIAESTQHSIMRVVHATRAALREQLQLAQAAATLERQQSRQRASIIAGASATLFAGLLTSGSLWAAGAAVFSASTQLAAVDIPGGGATVVAVEGSTAEALLNSLSDAVSQIVVNDSEQHELLADQIKDVLQRVETLLGGSDGELGRLIPIRPDIVDGVDSGSFYLP
ncbi:MAG: hypothetical protein ACRDT2_03795 [Natronosporangium sp.]